MSALAAFGQAVAVGIGCLTLVGGVTAMIWALADAVEVTR
jgi:hypothetical protein